MKIRTKITIQNLCVVASVFVLSLWMIYIASEHARSRTFFRDLRSEAVTKANLFLENKVDASVMQSIYLNNRKFINEVEVAVYSPDFRMLYHDAVSNDIIKETQAMIDEILEKGEIEFYVGDYQGIGMLYHFEGEDYVVTAAAYDGYGYANLEELQRILIILFVVSLAVLSVICYFLAWMSLKPIRGIISDMENITASRIDRRLPVSESEDELGELCMAFNSLLERLEQSFNSQKMFVSNVSHEMRTPLAALIAELDLTLQRERSGEQYRSAISNSLSDARRMTSLIDGLLNLARADYMQERIKMEPLRMDEILLDVRSCILKAHPDFSVELIFGNEGDDDSLITVNANNYLLSIAFSNLIENNCKYSGNRTSFVQISYSDIYSVIYFSDSGSGMSEEDKKNVFNLFYRGEHKDSVEGHGIGLALVQKIIQLHHGTVEVQSEEGKGTTFIVKIPHV